MCYNKIRLRNKRFTDVNSIDNDGFLYRDDHTQYFHEVGCGHCEACLQLKRDGYLLRSLAEFSRASEVAVFATLTYNDTHLPVYYWQDTPLFSDALYSTTCDYARPTGDIDQFGNVSFVIGDILLQEAELLTPNIDRVSSVWCKKHIQKFFKSLREKLIYDYGAKCLHLQRLETINGHRRKSSAWKAYEATKPNFLRYFCVCERGSNRQYIDDNGHVRYATSRPHYHLILFVNNSFFTTDYLFTLISKFWLYGNVKNLQIGNDAQEQRSFGRSPLKCMEYVTKYVTKDIDDVTCNIPFASHSDLLNYSPFVTLSKHYGSCLLDNFSEKEIVDIEVNGINIPTSDGLGRVIPLPSYYSDKTGNYVTIKSKVTELRKLDPYYSDGFLNIPACASNIYEANFSFDKPLDYGYEYVDCIKSTRYITPKGSIVREKRRQKRLEHFLNLYNTACSLRQDTPYYHPFIDDVTLEDFRYYISNLYTSKHFSEQYPLEHAIYQHFVEVDNLLSHQKRELHRLKFENNLPSAMEHKPKLFKDNYL